MNRRGVRKKGGGGKGVWKEVAKRGGETRNEVWQTIIKEKE